MPARMSAGQTRTWTQGEAADFEKGNLKNICPCAATGACRLAPRLAGALRYRVRGYLWALARDSKGNLYAGGGRARSCSASRPMARARLLADLDALEIHAIAIDSARPRVRRHLARRQGLSHRRQRQAGGLLRPQGEVHLGAWRSMRQGDLFVATGDQGEIHRVTPDGKGAVFFKSEETHVRSLAIDAQGQSDSSARIPAAW